MKEPIEGLTLMMIFALFITGGTMWWGLAETDKAHMELNFDNNTYNVEARAYVADRGDDVFVSNDLQNYGYNVGDRIHIVGEFDRWYTVRAFFKGNRQVTIPIHGTEEEAMEWGLRFYEIILN